MQSHHVDHHAVQLILTPEIQKVIDIYEKTRSMDLDNSFILEEPEQKTNSDILDEVGETFLNGAMGAVGGWKAAFVNGGVKLVGKISEKAIGLVHSSPKITVYNLHYLTAEQFKENLNLTSAQLKTLQSLFDLTCLYQSLKGSRPGIRFLNLGEHRRDDQIDDVKYLINILIGRKLAAAARAANKEKYTQHLKHLSSFVEEISKEHSLLTSNSNDTWYLSIRGVINTVKYDLLEIENQNHLSQDKPLQKIVTNNQEIKENIFGFTETIKNKLIALVSLYKPCDFSSSAMTGVTDHLSFTKNDYFKVLQKVFTTHLDITDQDWQQFFIGLSNFANKKIENQQEIKTAFAAVITNKRTIDRLLQLLDTLDQVSKQGGYLALTNVIHEMQFLYIKIKEEIEKLIQSQRNFISKLQSLYSNSSQAFKNNFTEHAYNKINFNFQCIDETIFLLHQLTVNKDVKNNLQEMLKETINAFCLQISNLGYQEEELLPPATPPSQLEQSVKDFIEQENADDELMKNWIEVVVKEDAQLIDKLPVTVKEKEWFWPMIGQKQSQEIAILSHQLNDTKLMNQKQSQEINNLTHTNQKQSQEIKNLKETNNKISNEINRLNTEQNKNKNIAICSKVRDIFQAFISDYQNRIITRPHYFFNRHNEKGYQLAESFKVIFLKNLYAAQEENSHISSSNFIFFIKNMLKKSIKEASQLDASHCYPHSQKTYLLAFNRFLAEFDQNENVSSENLVRKYHHDIYVIGKDKKPNYEKEFQQTFPSPIPPTDLIRTQVRSMRHLLGHTIVIN